MLHAAGAPGLLLTPRKGLRPSCDSQQESSKSFQTWRGSNFRRRAETSGKPRGTQGAMLTAYLQKSPFQRSSMSSRGSTPSLIVGKTARGLHQRVQQQLQAYENTTNLDTSRPKTTPAGGTARRAAPLQYPAAASRRQPNSSCAQPGAGFRQSDCQPLLNRSIRLEQPLSTSPHASTLSRVSESSVSRFFHGDEIQERPATAADASTVLKQMLKQGGISHTDKFQHDHQSLENLLQAVARDVLAPRAVLAPDKNSRSSRTQQSSSDQPLQSREGKSKATATRKNTSVQRKAEPVFAGTWKEWCQAEDGRKQSQKRNIGKAAPGVPDSAMGSTMAAESKILQHPFVDIGADFRSTVAPSGVYLVLPCVRTFVTHFWLYIPLGSEQQLFPLQEPGLNPDMAMWVVK